MSRYIDIAVMVALATVIVCCATRNRFWPEAGAASNDTRDVPSAAPRHAYRPPPLTVGAEPAPPTTTPSGLPLRVPAAALNQTVLDELAAIEKDPGGRDIGEVAA